MPAWELSDRRQSQILGVLLLALGALTAVSLFTYDIADWPHALGTGYRNACGPVGALFAFALRFIFGKLAVWAVPVALFAWGWNRLRQNEAGELAVRTAIGAAILVTFVTLVALWVPEAWTGRVGGALAGVVTGVLSRVGSVILLGTLLTVLLLVASEVGFSLVAQGMGAALRMPLRLGMGLAERLRPGSRRAPRRRAEKPARGDERDEKGGKPGMKIVREPGAARAAAEADDLDLEEIAPGPPAKKPAPQIHLPFSGGARPKPEKPREKPAAPMPPAVVTSGDLPPTTLLAEPIVSGEVLTEAELKAKAQVLERTLAEFDVLAQVSEIHPGPVVTMFELEPGPGVKVSQIVTRSDDLALALRAKRIRILAPIPGKAAVGIEVPNPNPQTVYVREVVETEAFRSGQGRMPIAMGKDTTGKVFTTDLTKAPHLLVAGATGSGKSVAMNVIMASLLLRHSPATLRLLLIDPKMLELTGYNGIPHLLWPVVTAAKPAARALRWVVSEMERRYRTLAGSGARHIDTYNAAVAQKGEGEKLPYIVVMVDELADLMLTLPMEIEEPIARLAQMARAVGIHLIVATQRPSVDVITGVIKANFPSRMSFQVASKVDSRTILDMNGADTLLGNGDMLFLPAGQPEPVRIHGAYISEAEVEALSRFWRERAPQGPPEPPVDLGREGGGTEEGVSEEDDVDDELVAEAARIVILSQRGSVSLLQRRLKIGYSRAGRIMDKLESLGVVGPFTGSQAREVLVDERYLEEQGLGRKSGV
ncbi:MAG: DNA translocase FtsK 4TM domain-containing protein [Candidatus Eisenbacteria bacterium]|nr:DNA translocase FtsK 4TM domain-containing protein [Candidatus Eisenbacteria bacterium]